MSKKKIFINFNGCPRRSLDCSRLGEYFRANKCELVGAPQEADFILFVTCSFKESREKECWELIEKYKSYKGELIVLGCLPEITSNKFLGLFKGRYLSTKDLNDIDKLFHGFKIKFKDIADAHQFYNSLYPPTSFFSRLWKRVFVLRITGAYLKKKWRGVKRRLTEGGLPKPPVPSDYGCLRICDGCIERCAYCCIYRAVGKLRSKSIHACMNEYKDILRRGYRKIILLADNVGAYGLDIKSSFGELLLQLSAVSQEKVHWYIQELHPRWVVQYKAALLKVAQERKMQEMLCAIQSGSNRILKLMNRHHSIEEIKEAFSELKRANSDLKLYTQIIIGFPTETEEDFQETLSAIKQVRFDMVTLYPYYDGYDTVASKMDGKIDRETIDRRMKTMADSLKAEGINTSFDDADLKLLEK